MGYPFVYVCQHKANGSKKIQGSVTQQTVFYANHWGIHTVNVGKGDYTSNWSEAVALGGLLYNCLQLGIQGPVTGQTGGIHIVAMDMQFLLMDIHPDQPETRT